MTYLNYTKYLLTLTAGMSLSSAALAQGVIQWLPEGTANWNVGANWQDIGFGNEVPSASFGDAALISSGGTAQVVDAPVPVGAVVINNGGVDITSSGVLVTSENVLLDPAATGNFTVNGGGSLRVVGGGELTVGANLGLGGVFTAGLTAAAQKPIDVAAGTANLGGALVIDVNGANVSAGNSWDLIDATAISGNFNSVTSTGTPLPLGRLFGVQQVAGGNGQLVRLSVDQRLVLTMNRETGVASIQNVGTSAVNIDFDNYLIQSGVGSLDPAAWNSLENQGVQAPGNPWYEAGSGGANPNALAEFNPTASATLTPGASRAIGSVYAPNYAGVPIGGETEDHTFTYTNNGETFQGIVNYVGDKQEHNLVLTVNPVTGVAVLQNESGVPIAFDSYSIASEGGGLLTSWNSLADQGSPGATWLEANTSANRLSEVAELGSTRLNTNEGFNLSNLFNTALAQDLTFQYLLADTNTVLDGVVVFGDLPTNLLPPSEFNPADFNQDGTVDAADYTVWRDGNSPDSSQAGYLLWRANYGAVQGGATAEAASVAAPEPGAMLLLAAAALLCPIRSRK